MSFESLTSDGDADVEHALVAAQLFVSDPIAFGGIVLRGAGPVRDALLSQILAALPDAMPRATIPANVDHEHLCGGLDWAATLAQGEPVLQQGLIAQVCGGVAVLRMAERIESQVAAHLAQAVDHSELALVILDDGITSDESPPLTLTERCAFQCDVSGAWSLDFELRLDTGAAKTKPLLTKQREVLASTAAHLGISSLRGLIFAERAARALAGMRGLASATDQELQDSAMLVLAHRAQHLPDIMPHEHEQPSPDPIQSNESSNEDTSTQSPPDIPLEDLVLDAVQSAIPPHILEQIANGTKRAVAGQSGKSGQKQKSARRGKPLGALPGVPASGKKLALIDTLRAAAPWQTMRQAEASEHVERIQIRKPDLRIRRFEEQRESLTIFVVDASGSSALARLAEAKGAVELMLAQVHVKRAQVALIAFRQSGAELLLPPTRSLTRARRALSALPGGGGTPLAASLIEACKLADAAEKRGQNPVIAMLTDGKGNITLNGAADRPVAMQEARDAAQQIAAAGHHAIVIDISPRPREEAASLAAALAGRYVPLPRANSAAMVSAIESVSESVAV